MSRRRAAVAGGAAAAVWAALEPFDRRLFDHDYSDVAMLGKLVTRSRLGRSPASRRISRTAPRSASSTTSRADAPARHHAGWRSPSPWPRTSCCSHLPTSSTTSTPRGARPACRRSSPRADSFRRPAGTRCSERCSARSRVDELPAPAAPDRPGTTQRRRVDARARSRGLGRRRARLPRRRLHERGRSRHERS